MTVYRLSKIHSAFHSFLSPRFTPTPTCSTRPCLGSEEGELLVATRPRYLPFPRNGKEAVDVSRWREGRCSRIVLYFPQGGGVITGTNHRGIARYLESIWEVGFMNGYGWSESATPVFLGTPPSSSSRNFSFQRDNRGWERKRVFVPLYVWRVRSRRRISRDGESTGVAIEISLDPFVLSCKFSSRAWRRKSA